LTVSEAHIRGEVQILPLDSVRPNDWNPNRVPAHIMESIKHGFRDDGWVVSQALLIWGSDDEGNLQNLIIDGEHRHAAAVEVGLKDGPMVVLDGLTKAEAGALTVKLNQKRGDWDMAQLSTLMQEIHTELPEMAAADFGFLQQDMERILATETGSFLDAFIDTATADSGLDGDAEEAGAPAEGGPGYVQFALKLTPAQDKTLHAALKLMKKRPEVRTNVDALLALCALAGDDS
jgi:hypothetical protein